MAVQYRSDSRSNQGIIAVGFLLAGVVAVLCVWAPVPTPSYEEFRLTKAAMFGVLGALCAVFLIIAPRPLVLDRLTDVPAVAAAMWGTVVAVHAPSISPAGLQQLGAFAAGLCLWFAVRWVRTLRQSEWLLSGMIYIAAAVSIGVLIEAWSALEFITPVGGRPGTVLGNRNDVARLLCLFLPLHWRRAATENRASTRASIDHIFVVCTVAAIVLTRSRGVWLVGGALAIALPLVDTARQRSRPSAFGSTYALWWFASVLAGALLALVVPNRLSWGLGDYQSTAVRVLDYRHGSGRGRVMQAQTTLRMIGSAAVVGIGPGRWSMLYPAFAREGDPSYAPDALYPAPLVPRGDVLSLTAEYGVPGLALALCTAWCIGVRALRMTHREDRESVVTGTAALATPLAGLALGLVDPVIRLAPLLATFVVLQGAYLGSPLGAESSMPASPLRRFGYRAVLTAGGAVALLGAEEAARELVAFEMVRSARSLSTFRRAVAFAPRSLDAQFGLANVFVAAGRCDLAEHHIRLANALQPFSRPVQQLWFECALSTAPK